MNDLSPAEIEALARAMGNISNPSEHNLAESGTTGYKKEKKNIPIETLKGGISRAQLVQLKEEAQLLKPTSDEEQERFNDIKLEIEVILGRTKMPIGKLFQLQSGSIVPLDKLAGEPVEIFANGKKIATGEIVIIEDENYGIKILDFITS